jgi:large subunit ribosomal protein L4
MRAQALFSVLSKKYKDGEILFVETLAPSEIKTKAATEVIKNLTKVSDWKILATAKKPKILTAISGRNEKTEKSFRNISSLEIVFLNNLNPLDVLNYRYLLIENPVESVKFLESRG